MYCPDNRTDLRKAAGSLSSQIQAVAPTTKNLAGSETNLGKFISRLPSLPAVTYTFDNSGGGALKRYIFGDPTTMIAAVDAGVLSNPDLVQGKAALVIPNKNFYYGVRSKFTQINYETSSTPSQFSNIFEHRVTNIAGVVNPTQISVAEAKSNVQQNDLLLTLKGEYDLDISSGYIIEVLAGEKVTMTCTVSLYVVE
jgi:hypothetical protein